MNKKIEKIFGTQKPIIGMLHLKGDNDKEIIDIADKELHLLLENGADGVLVENYFGNSRQAEMVLKYVSETYPDICYGINLLHDDELGFELAGKYHAKFIQLDSVSGHLSPEEDEKFEQFINTVRKKTASFVLGGVRFKYQPYKSGRRLDEDLAIGMKRCDAIVVTGDATGQETNLSKISNFRNIIGEFPLFVGAGMTPENVADQLNIADGAIVGSYFKDTYKDTGNICGEHVLKFMNEVKEVRNNSFEKDATIIKEIKEYSTYKDELFSKDTNFSEFIHENNLSGMEIFMDDVISRDQMLYTNKTEKELLVEELKNKHVKRVHCSYWAYPTSFLTKNNFSELVDRFENLNAVKEYYGDLTGNHMYERWLQEYVIATELDAQAYTFHLIDYAPIDGKWGFTIQREDISQAMIYMIQEFINRLLERGLITENSPQIEVENAGWGLEYGLQTADDFEKMFQQLYDPFDKVRIGWDINHLLHAIGFSEKEQRAEFFLTNQEMTEEMHELEEKYGNIQQVFARKWIEKNFLNRSIIDKIGSLHLSDCKMKTIAYFKNGLLIGKYNEVMQSLEKWEDMEEYGVGIVLKEYDSHEILSEGILSGVIIRSIISKLQKINPNLVILHELKNSKKQLQALKKQREELWNKLSTEKTAKYIVTGPTIINDIVFADKSKSTCHLGGSIFCVEGIKIWNNDCLYISNVGNDFEKFYGEWMEKNNCSLEGMQYILPHTQYTELIYGDEGLHSEVSIYGEKEEQEVEKLDIISARVIASYCDNSTKGIYIEASETSQFWDELDVLRNKTHAKIMWEIPTSATMTENRHQKVLECIKKTDIYSLNYPEAKCLFRVETETEAIDKIKELNVPCFFRVGSKGSYMIAEGKAEFAHSLTVGEIVDPTGCGNCSTAAAMYGWCEGNSLYKTAMMANISAAYNLLQYGPYPAITKEVQAQAQELLEEKLQE